MSAQYSFLRAGAGWRRDSLSLITVWDEAEEFSKSCQYTWYVHSEPKGRQWGTEKLEMWIVGMTAYQRPETARPRFALISAEGDVVFQDDPTAFEKIPGTGVSSPDSTYLGRMNAIAGVGTGLFACGNGGQIYQRVGDNDWRCIAPELLKEKGDRSGKWDWYIGIGGTSETDVYFVGEYGKIQHWDGVKMRPIVSPTPHFLVWVLVESETSIWMGGARGTLLNGNWKDGFRQIPNIDTGHHFNSATFYQGKLWLASALGELQGIYVYDNDVVAKVTTGLEPEPAEINQIDAGAGVLWGVGGKDIVHFDGESWERIDFPFNTPYRG